MKYAGSTALSTTLLPSLPALSSGSSSNLHVKRQSQRCAASRETGSIALRLAGPRNGFLLPNAVGILFLERLYDLSEHCVIVRGLVAADAAPVHRFRGCVGLRVLLQNLFVQLLRFHPFLLHEPNPGQP